MLTLLAQAQQDVADALGWEDLVRLAALMVALVGGLVGLGKALSKRITREAQRAAQSADAARRELATSNGHTAGQVLDDVATDTAWLREQSEQNRETALSALALSREAVALGRSNSEQLAQHERVGHGG